MSFDTDGPRGLGGWLILPIIGLFVSIVNIGRTLTEDTLPVFSDGTWQLLTSPGSEYYVPGWGALIIVELLGNLLLLGAAVALIILVFSKSPRFPTFYIYFLVFNAVFVIGDVVAAHLVVALSAEESIDLGSQVLRAVLGAAIWIPYMLKSKRVKNTFVERPLSPPFAGASPVSGPYSDRR